LNGLQATHFVGTRRNDSGQSQNVELTVVTGPEQHNYIFLYAAKDPSTLQRAYRQLQEAESSFRPLSAADRGAARPWTIKVVALPRGGFAELARNSVLTTNAEGQLRLLNGVYAGGDAKAGQPVKIVL
jgi:predicted Zn-dependent protease